MLHRVQRVVIVGNGVAHYHVLDVLHVLVFLRKKKARASALRTVEHCRTIRCFGAFFPNGETRFQGVPFQAHKWVPRPEPAKARAARADAVANVASVLDTLGNGVPQKTLRAVG